MLTNITWQSTNKICAFLHGSRPVGQIRKNKEISYICPLEKNFEKPQLLPQPDLIYSKDLISRSISGTKDRQLNFSCSCSVQFITFSKILTKQRSSCMRYTIQPFFQSAYQWELLIHIVLIHNDTYHLQNWIENFPLMHSASSQIWNAGISSHFQTWNFLLFYEM